MNIEYVLVCLTWQFLCPARHAGTSARRSWKILHQLHQYLVTRVEYLTIVRCGNAKLTWSSDSSIFWMYLSKFTPGGICHHDKRRWIEDCHILPSNKYIIMIGARIDDGMDMRCIVRKHKRTLLKCSQENGLPLFWLTVPVKSNFVELPLYKFSLERAKNAYVLRFGIRALLYTCSLQGHI